MKASGVAISSAAQDVVSVTQRVLGADHARAPDVVDARTPPDLQDAMMDLKRNSYAHLANGRVAKTTDTLLESVLEIGDNREK